MTDSQKPTRSYSHDKLVDQLLDEFEAGWKAGDLQVLEEYLAKAPAAKADALLADLLYIELFYRRKAGETPVLEEYLSRIPGCESLFAWTLKRIDSVDAATLATPPSATFQDAPAASEEAAGKSSATFHEILGQVITSEERAQSPARRALRMAELERYRFHRQRIAIVCTAIVGMVATFLPWVLVPGTGSVPGIADITGWICLTLFVPALVLALYGDRQTILQGGYRLGAAIPAGLAALYGMYAILQCIRTNEMLSTLRRTDGSFSTGPGTEFGKSVPARFDVGIGVYLLISAGGSLVILAWVLADIPRDVRAKRSTSVKQRRSRKPRETASH